MTGPEEMERSLASLGRHQKGTGLEVLTLDELRQVRAIELYPMEPSGQERLPVERETREVYPLEDLSCEQWGA